MSQHYDCENKQDKGWLPRHAHLPCEGEDRDEATNMVMHLATHPALDAPSAGGGYYTMNNWPLQDCGLPAAECARRDANPLAMESRLQDELFLQTCKMAGMNRHMCTCLLYTSPSPRDRG